MAGENNIAYATLDIGTSQIKLGVYCPFLSDRITLVDNLKNELVYGSAGEVRAEYSIVREKAFQLFRELGSFLKSNNVNRLYIGICGHVSSLIEWNKSTGTPPIEPFPIWLDTTCFSSVDEFNKVMGGGRSKEIIGTFLPQGTNWLLTKLLHRKQSGFSNDAIFLQVSDCIFYELSGKYETHFSSQISMVDLRKREYARELLDHLNLEEASLPTIAYEPSPVLQSIKSTFEFPDETFVFPAMADLYTSLYGLRLQDKEGFMLANTSEQAGAFYRRPPKVLNNFLSISFNDGFINYGSTNTGGNVLSWFLANILKKKVTSALLDELTVAAAEIDPADTPVILPYLQGERAPLWNSKLTATILELRSSHTDVHLFRAILESIAFARRQCFDEIGMEDLHLVKLGGGSSKNSLWNSIRASVLNKPIAVADEKELSMAGIIYYVMEASQSRFTPPPINFGHTGPIPELVSTYDEKYSRFIKYQKLLS